VWVRLSLWMAWGFESGRWIMGRALYNLQELYRYVRCF
jgi:hypothetical protein